MSTLEPSGREKLRNVLRAGEFVLAPGVYDMVSARIADTLGFKACYMSGYAVTLSHLGLPDAGLTTYSEMLERASMIAGGTTTPLIADADTGFGGLLNVRRTVQGYEKAGVQGIQIEDQRMPKQCGQLGRRQVVPLGEMVKRIEVAVEARHSDDFLVVARTDCRGELGVDAVIERSRAFVAAGADVVFPEALETEAEFDRLGAELGSDTWLLANMVPEGRSPIIGMERLRQLGFSLSIFPGAGLAAACAALEQTYRYMAEHGTVTGSPVPAYTLPRLHELAGFADVWAFEQRHE